MKPVGMPQNWACKTCVDTKSIKTQIKLYVDKLMLPDEIVIK